MGDMTSDENLAGKAAEPSASRKDSLPEPRFKRVLIALAVVLTATGIAYLVGRLQTAERIDAAKAETREALEAKAGAERTLLRLEARRRLHLAIMALDRRNFGIAEQHLTAAARLLESSKPEGELEALRNGIAARRLRASDNASDEQKQVRDFAAKLDELVPPAEAK